MTTIASLAGSSSSYQAHGGHKTPGRSLLKAGQSLLAGVTGGASSLSGLAKTASTGASTGLKAIQNAISTALEEAKQNGSTTDSNQVIKNAIKQVFKSGLTTASEAANGLNDDSSDGSGTTPSAAMPKTFQQVLQSFGVSPDQFRKDLASAIQETTSGSTDATNPSTSINAGTLLNAIG